jgi:hypothetical protein
MLFFQLQIADVPVRLGVNRFRGCEGSVIAFSAQPASPGSPIPLPAALPLLLASGLLPGSAEAKNFN